MPLDKNSGFFCIKNGKPCYFLSRSLRLGVAKISHNWYYEFILRNTRNTYLNRYLNTYFIKISEYEQRKLGKADR